MSYRDILERLYKEFPILSWDEVLPSLLNETLDNNEDRAVVHCSAARYFIAIANVDRANELLSAVRAMSSSLVSEGQYQLAVTEAYHLSWQQRHDESDEKLKSIFSSENEVRGSVLSWAYSVKARNEAMRGEYAVAIRFSREALDLRPSDPVVVGHANMTLAYAFQSMGRYEESEQYALNQLQFYNNAKWKRGAAQVLAFLAVGATSQGNLEKGKQYRAQAINLLEESDKNSPLFLWFADMHLGLGEYQEAQAVALNALKVAEQANDQLYIATSQMVLGRVLIELGQYEQAVEQLRAALEKQYLLGDMQRISLYRYIARALRILSRKEENADICWALWELQKDFDRRTRDALLDYQLKLQQRIHDQQTALLQAKSTSLERELSLRAIGMAAQTDLLARFRDDLRTVVRDVSDPLMALKRVKEKLKTLPCEQIDWTKFEAEFTSVHPDFSANLIQRYPSLTQAEVRLCKLLRLDLKSHEIARLLCLSERTIETQRFAVRRKLGLRREDSIAKALAQFTQ